MMIKLKELQSKIDNLTVRERGAIFFCSLFVIYFVWDTFLIQPLQQKETLVLSRLKQKQVEQFALNIQLQRFNVSQNIDSDTVDREKLQVLKTKLAATEAQIQDSTQHLIPPKEMAVMLETVLNKVKGLELLHVKGLAGKPLVERKVVNANEKSEEDTEDVKLPESVVDNAYKHGLEIVFQGDYMSTLEYIRELENLHWGFFWESLQLEVKEYPNSVVAITVFTLSLDKNWIGV